MNDPTEIEVSPAQRLIFSTTSTLSIAHKSFNDSIFSFIFSCRKLLSIFANNFPTALTIATRYRETHCGYYLPSNGDGPFQILSKDYGTGEINEDTFTQSIQDFIDFSKGKYAHNK